MSSWSYGACIFFQCCLLFTRVAGRSLDSSSCSTMGMCFVSSFTTTPVNSAFRNNPCVPDHIGQTSSTGRLWGRVSLGERLILVDVVRDTDSRRHMVAGRRNKGRRQPRLGEEKMVDVDHCRAGLLVLVRLLRVMCWAVPGEVQVHDQGGTMSSAGIFLSKILSTTTVSGSLLDVSKPCIKILR